MKFTQANGIIAACNFFFCPCLKHFFVVCLHLLASVSIADAHMCLALYSVHFVIGQRLTTSRNYVPLQINITEYATHTVHILYALCTGHCAQIKVPSLASPTSTRTISFLMLRWGNISNANLQTQEMSACVC